MDADTIQKVCLLNYRVFYIWIVIGQKIFSVHLFPGEV